MFPCIATAILVSLGTARHVSVVTDITNGFLARGSKSTKFIHRWKPAAATSAAVSTRQILPGFLDGLNDLSKSFVKFNKVYSSGQG